MDLHEVVDDIFILFSFLLLHSSDVIVSVYNPNIFQILFMIITIFPRLYTSNISVKTISTLINITSPRIMILTYLIIQDGPK